MNSKSHIIIAISRGWLTTCASTIMGIVLGILYVWSVITSAVPDSWGWSNADKALPYSIMTIICAFTMIPAGKLQDTIGPRKVILTGGFLSGLGCIISGMGGDSLIAYITGFGLCTGVGVAFGYCALAPSAMKWFPPRKTGIIVGIVVSGIGLAPVFLAPLSAWLLDSFQVVSDSGIVEKGVSATMITLGLAIWIVIGVFAGCIQIPPAGYIPEEEPTPQQVDTSPSHTVDMNWKQMISTTQFWLLFFMFFAGSAAGLIIISVATELGRNTLGSLAFLTVIVLSFGNSGGRILAGMVSDKIGRQATMFCEFSCQAITVTLLYWTTKQGGASWPLILFLVFMIGLNYGSNHALFPAVCKDYYGLRNFGFNYGLLFSAFGTAGLVMPWLNGFLQDITNRPDSSYVMIIVMMILAAAVALVSRTLGTPKPH